MKIVKLLAILISLLATGLTRADVVMQFDFSNVSSKSVTDPISGITATLSGSAKVVDLGDYKVMNLGTSSGYLNMTADAGKLFAGLDKYSVSVYYKVDKNANISGAGNFLWAFSTSAACDASTGTYSAYRINAQRMANAPAGFGSETGFEVGKVSAKGSWIHVVYTQTAASGKLYINGELVGSSTSMAKNSTMFSSTKPQYCWIGRPPFSGDAYLASTEVTDFCVYDNVLTAAQIKELSAKTAQLEQATRYGTPGDFSTLKTAVEQAKTFVASLDMTQFPMSAIAEYQDAITICEAIINEGKVNQTIINEYKSGLASAKTKLNAAKGKKWDISDAYFGYDSQRGFIHPGGLHTQADFDRIKQQLANGNTKVKQAYNVLQTAAYAQPSAATYPVETIVRGGGVGENYINAARGATIAYQNGLRWKIEGNKQCAQHAVDVLMQWARTTKGIGGDSNYALAAGIYGYEFAQAAELVRDYEGWSKEDFQTFRRWMLDVWYPSAIGFMRGRNGTWENVGKWWQAPGHYWSNWGLCNALCIITIGVLCDDVYIYNQGMSYIKYDQCGTFRDPRTATPILNDGLAEFWGNLIVTTTPWEKETGAYGKVGQMNESGRDAGHCGMAVGLAIDIAHQGYNQGDDLFAWMDHRLAAGVEYVAAQSQNVEDLPWTNYHYASSGYYYTDSRAWLMTGPAMGAHIRPCWGAVIGHYEGIKGVKMPFSEKAYNQMGIDGGGAGGTSGGYDHLGYSVLMNTRDGIAAPEQVPTELAGWITYNGKTVKQSDMGGLKNTFAMDNNTGVVPGTVLTLKPQLPADEEDTGKWLWESGETTRDITVVADHSYVYRVTYTNKNGVESQQCFAIYVQGDCEEDKVVATVIQGEETKSYTVASGATVNITATYGSPLEISINGRSGWGSIEWDNGQTTSNITLPYVTSSRTLQAVYKNQGGRKTLVNFRLNADPVSQNISVGTKSYSDTTMVIVASGANVILQPVPAQSRDYGKWKWDNGSTERELAIEGVTETCTRTVEYTIDGVTTSYDFIIYVKEGTERKIDNADYCIVHRPTGLYLTNEDGVACLRPRQTKTAEEGLSGDPSDISNTANSQIWYVERATGSTYHFISLQDSTFMKYDLAMVEKLATRPHHMTWASGTNYAAIYYSSKVYWTVDDYNNIHAGSNGSSTLTDYPFEFIPVNGQTGLDAIATSRPADNSIFDLSGRKVVGRAPAGIYIRNGKKVVIR